MEIHLIDGAGQSFVFPVNPEEITISRSKGVETVNIVSLGEYDFPAGERVKEIAFSSFFPAVYDPGYCNYQDLPDPQEAMNRLTIMMNSKSPVRLIITDTAVNVLVTIAAHNSTFRGGEPGDVYFDLTARTWREMKVHTQTGAGGAASTAKSTRPDTKKPAKTYVVKSGDTLSKIAKLELGDSSKWQQLYKANQKTIGKDPNQIKHGQKLVMPQ
ncbi:LysM peptidoglycan-binding domain-containing protein [Paenibacillus barengoltzii]|uniref:LysM peptidoglycan-binding domain-containing protein n=1 Tax=Paenibacillus barengoltzii TaxID=343517 RepID=UPI002DBD7D81|nr:LysM peptidoglycan-binding domain-containing protein [Paenibacillus barengoltzii]MEC2342979.1 LysM peptidoglycan-binding domain-containing protein [Paenibacillus barengoltzii]